HRAAALPMPQVGYDPLILGLLESAMRAIGHCLLQTPTTALHEAELVEDMVSGRTLLSHHAESLAGTRLEALYFLDRFDESIELCASLMDQPGPHPFVSISIARNLIELGDLDGAGHALDAVSREDQGHDRFVEWIHVLRSLI